MCFGSPIPLMPAFFRSRSIFSTTDVGCSLKSLHKFVRPGTIVTTQAQADALPARVGSPYGKINSAVLHVNQELAKGYNAQTIHRLATEIEDQLEQEEMLQTASPTGNINATNTNTSSNSSMAAEIK